MDLDGNGVFDKSELGAALQGLGVQLSNEELDEVYGHFDRDNSKGQPNHCSKLVIQPIEHHL